MFRKKPHHSPDREPLKSVVNFPNGTVVETSKGFFYIKNNVRLRIPNEKVLASWRFVNVPLFTEDALVNYAILGKLPYRDGTLLRNFADRGKDYFVSGGKLRLLTNPLWLEWLGLNENDVIIVSQEEFDTLSLGEPLK